MDESDFICGFEWILLKIKPSYLKHELDFQPSSIQDPSPILALAFADTAYAILSFILFSNAESRLKQTNHLVLSPLSRPLSDVELINDNTCLRSRRPSRTIE